MDEKVQATEAVSEILGLLSEERELAAVMREHVALHKHAASTAAGIEHLAFARFEHGHDGLHDALGREVFPTPLALGIGELADEVFVDPPQHVHAAGIGAEDVLREKIDEAGDAFFVEVRAGVNGRKQTLEFGKGPFEQSEDVVEPELDVVGTGDFDDVIPPGFFRDEEDVFVFEVVGVFADFKRELFVGGVEVALWVGNLGVDFAEALFVAKREEAEKNERQDVTLVIRRLDAAAQGDGGVPEFPKEVAQSAVAVFLFVRRLGFVHRKTVNPLVA